ncbi:hypothetical protein METBIDRAFT_10301 [Metschnikowia bicuspidata var. bicuspidata NRRL YB-4993]|uniref:Uncharacterized protein n=1 Tax=Metschnikowia bicuspidata var. bicuspidata NRRL YB-4993 TaxID=869754 RepID=A0A1A0HJZ6_9ASCO|nr:hypothetical protein METBIDRAFT_10301 [Metschnikowia bicuspidata var. bicuspidata NRRL YB-4993]OBA24133.1 hypothetical protein METBIDRAFT_10301 [Metschnikowia bicuspidata var. bicuspidata NRRL YB-4993]
MHSSRPQTSYFFCFPLPPAVGLGWPSWPARGPGAHHTINSTHHKPAPTTPSSFLARLFQAAASDILRAAARKVRPLELAAGPRPLFVSAGPLDVFLLVFFVSARRVAPAGPSTATTAKHPGTSHPSTLCDAPSARLSTPKRTKTPKKHHKHKHHTEKRTKNTNTNSNKQQQVATNNNK